METAESAIQFLVDFVGRDLSVFSDKDWATLRAHTKAFLTSTGRPASARGGLVVNQLVPFYAEQLSDEDLRELQHETRKFIAPFVEATALKRAHAQHAPTVTIKGPIDILPHALARDDDETSRNAIGFSILSGSTRDVFLLVASRLVEFHATDRIRQCQDPKCTKIFYGTTRRQVFCSERCRSRRNMNAKRKRDARRR